MHGIPLKLRKTLLFCLYYSNKKICGKVRGLVQKKQAMQP